MMNATYNPRLDTKEYRPGAPGDVRVILGSSNFTLELTGTITWGATMTSEFTTGEAQMTFFADTAITVTSQYSTGTSNDQAVITAVTGAVSWNTRALPVTLAGQDPREGGGPFTVTIELVSTTGFSPQHSWRSSGSGKSVDIDSTVFLPSSFTGTWRAMFLSHDGRRDTTRRTEDVTLRGSPSFMASATILWVETD